MRTLLILTAPVALLVGCGNGKNNTTDSGTTADDPCETPGAICTWLGEPGLAQFSADGTDRLKTLLYLPQDITFLPDGTAFYPDFNNHRIRKVDTNGVVTTISGTGMLGDGPNTDGSTNNCWGGCDAMQCAWNHPENVTVDPSDPTRVFVAAWHNSRINVIDTATSTMTWYAGTGGRFYANDDTDGDGNVLNNAILDLPSSVAFGPDGSLYFSDQANHVIRRITPDGGLDLIAGEPRHPGFDGDGGPAADAHLHGHINQQADPGSKLDISGHDLYFTDTVNGVVRHIDLDSMIIDTVAGKYDSLGPYTYTDGITGVQFQADSGSKTGYAGDGGDALDATLNTPRDVAVGIDGELYIADTMNDCVRVVGTDGVINTFAGQCGQSGFSGDEGPATDALMGNVFGVAVDYDGNVYIADTENQVIRRVKH